MTGGKSVASDPPGGKNQVPCALAFCSLRHYGYLSDHLSKYPHTAKDSWILTTETPVVAIYMIYGSTQSLSAVIIEENLGLR